MRVPSGRRRAAIVATLATLLVLSVGAPAMAAEPPPGLHRFMDAVGQVESGGRYTARNPTSGAYGKYQIMPANWPSWAERYLGDAKARQTPANQEKVAAGKFTTLYRKYGQWRAVAFWWLTGSARTTNRSTYATRYVARVMRLYRSGSDPTTPRPTAKHVSEKSAEIAYSGAWSTAHHRDYAGGGVRYATAPGSAATLSFSGTRITWWGPSGPTRGKARVYLDGTYVRTVNLWRETFSAHRVLFRAGWSAASSHTVTIEVVGTGGHPMVAIDEFVVSR